LFLQLLSDKATYLSVEAGILEADRAESALLSGEKLPDSHNFNDNVTEALRIRTAYDVLSKALGEEPDYFQIAL
jgi:hypothetical protein